mmetsp:Transcript_24600/g.79504  ORF Transcript_24600/g.79504 Transcript_24600/m.79504 type:complete len:266 (+) Transcript_24600:449-1246(+)
MCSCLYANSESSVVEGNCSVFPFKSSGVKNCPVSFRRAACLTMTLEALALPEVRPLIAIEAFCASTARESASKVMPRRVPSGNNVAATSIQSPRLAPTSTKATVPELGPAATAWPKRQSVAVTYLGQCSSPRARTKLLMNDSRVLSRRNATEHRQPKPCRAAPAATAARTLLGTPAREPMKASMCGARPQASPDQRGSRGKSAAGHSPSFARARGICRTTLSLKNHRSSASNRPAFAPSISKAVKMSLRCTSSPRARNAQAATDA